jgi:hypothetical protein
MLANCNTRSYAVNLQCFGMIYGGNDKSSGLPERNAIGHTRARA